MKAERPGRQDWRGLHGAVGVVLAIVCLGHVDVFDPGPRLEIDGWRARQPLDSVVYENYWGHPARDLCPAPSTERGPCE